MQVDSDRTFRLAAGVPAVWESITRFDEYQRWWPWLRRLDADAFDVGERWRCTVRPPLPYSLRFVIELVDIDSPHRVEADVSGDIAGGATLTIRARGAGTEVRLVSSLAPARGTLRRVATLAPWLARFGHDWVLDAGVRQFRHHALPPEGSS